MQQRSRLEFVLIGVFFLFSVWLMYKSFSYDAANHEFHIARNEVGDFGLHLSLIRSISWGNNIPAESPFYPGLPLPYHYFFDFTVGLLERLGVRIDIALNGLSAVAFTVLLYTVYKLSQLLFEHNVLLGITSVILFLFSSSMSFFEAIFKKTISFSTFRDIWYLPDYLHKGPFDGSIISIYFTPAVFLNQRHLIAGMCVGIVVIYKILKKILADRMISLRQMIVFGMVTGLISRIHSLVFVGTFIVVTSLIILFKRWKMLFPFISSTILVVSLLYINVAGQGTRLLTSNIFHPGFLSTQPFSLTGFMDYWLANLGLATIIIPISFIYSSKIQKKVFLSFFILFIIANTFQLSFRIEHNHSLLNYFLLLGNCYSAFILVRLRKVKIVGNFIYIVFLFLMTASGFTNLAAVKNDFQYPVNDAPKNKLMKWIKESTDKNAVFLSRQDLYDPVTLSGRRNYFGASYYLLVMGYNLEPRANRTKQYFEANEPGRFEEMRREGIRYIVLPLKRVDDFPYSVNLSIFERNLTTAYSDETYKVFSL